MANPYADDVNREVNQNYGTRWEEGKGEDYTYIYIGFPF